MTHKKIKIGDIVRVNFNNAQVTLTNHAIVHWVPGSIGDSWILEDTDTKEIHYVSEGCTVTLLRQ